MPDRYFTCMYVSNVGHYASAGAAYQHWVFPLSVVVHPFNNVDGDNAIPNPISAVATTSPAGLQNILYNTTTNTGLWSYYRVWRCKVELNCQPTNGADTTIMVASPANGTSVPPYANIVNAQDAPGSQVIITSQANPTPMNTISKWFDIPQVLGTNPADYGAFASNSYGSYGNLPGDVAYIFVTSTTENDAVYAANCGLSIRLCFEVEFFQRTDTVLLDA